MYPSPLLLKRALFLSPPLSLAFSQGKMWYDFRSKVNPYMMQPRTVQAHIVKIDRVTSDFVDRMRALRDPETLELPDNFLNELNKWALECECTRE